MKITKTVIAMIILILWAVFSIFYIGWVNWNSFKLNQLRNAANQGYQQGIIDVATAASKCEPNGVPLNLGNDKDGKPVSMTIVSTACLQQAQPQTPAAAPATPKK
jgi:hypothetical protein